MKRGLNLLLAAAAFTFGCSDDGGSGTAVLLELATVLKERPPSIGVVLVFFDGEDHGAEGTDDYFVGSRRLVSDWDELFGDTRPELAVIVDEDYLSRCRRT